MDGGEKGVDRRGGKKISTNINAKLDRFEKEETLDWKKVNLHILRTTSEGCR